MSHNKGVELSFEFFPPKTPQGSQKLFEVWRQLAELKPKFFSVTYGAGGSTRKGTLDTVRAIRGDGHEAVPHLSCVGASRGEIEAILEEFRTSGIRHLVALRGDLPSGMAAVGELAHGSDLVALIRKATGRHFRIDVACYPECHPQARSARDDLLNFKRKVEAGADAAITQYFYNADSYFRFVDECAAEGIAVPILPGIMPIGNFTQLVRFSEACGTEIPRWLRLRMHGHGEDLAAIRAFGLDVVGALCERLLAGGAPGLHFYTLNHADLVMEIWKRVSTRS